MYHVHKYVKPMDFFYLVSASSDVADEMQVQLHNETRYENFVEYELWLDYQWIKSSVISCVHFLPLLYSRARYRA